MNSDIVSVRSFAQGDVVFRDGDPGGIAFLVREGMVQINRSDTSGHEKVIGYAGPGQIFGEEGLISDASRSGTAVASKTSKCIAIDRTKLVKTLKNQDPFVAALYNILASNMQSMIDKGAELDCLLQDLSELPESEVPAPAPAPKTAAQDKTAPAAAQDEEEDDAFLI